MGKEKFEFAWWCLHELACHLICHYLISCLLGYRFFNAKIGHHARTLQVRLLSIKLSSQNTEPLHGASFPWWKNCHPQQTRLTGYGLFGLLIYVPICTVF